MYKFSLFNFCSSDQTPNHESTNTEIFLLFSSAQNGFSFENQNITRQKNADIKGYFAYQKWLYSIKINKLIFVKNLRSVVSGLGD